MLLLGGNGFIGSHLIDKLLYEGHRVTVYDKYMEYFQKAIKGCSVHIWRFREQGCARKFIAWDRYCISPCDVPLIQRHQVMMQNMILCQMS